MYILEQSRTKPPIAHNYFIDQFLTRYSVKQI